MTKQIITSPSYLEQLKQANFNLDANNLGYFARQLELIETELLQVEYPQLKATQLIPVQTYAGQQQWAETQTYRQWDRIGKAKVIADWGDDFRQVGIKATEYTGQFYEVGDSYTYSFKQLKQSQFAGHNLPTDLAMASKQAIDESIDYSGWFGHSASGVTGFLNNSDVPRSDVAADGTGSSTLWSTKTAALIYRDMVEAVSEVNSQSNGVEMADTLILPLEQYNHINTTIYNTYSDSSILDVFRKNYAGVLVDSVLQLEDAGTASADIMIAYTRNPNKVAYRLPIPFMQFPLFNNGGTKFEIKMLARMGDVVFKRPKSAVIKEGI